MRERIFEKWSRLNGRLTRYTDSSRKEVVEKNLKFESVSKNPGWVVNWDATLTPTEVVYVYENRDHMIQYMVSYWLRHADYDRLQRYIKNVAANAHSAKERYNAGIKLAVSPDVN